MFSEQEAGAGRVSEGRGRGPNIEILSTAEIHSQANCTHRLAHAGNSWQGFAFVWFLLVCGLVARC